MTTVSVHIEGARELALKFDELPVQIREKLAGKLEELTEMLAGRIVAAAPRKSGRLRSEIKGRVFSSNDRVAGYVSVYAPGIPGEYAKAATLEYGSDKIRRRRDSTGRRIASKMAKPAHIMAYAYLRGPFTEMLPEMQSALEEAIAEALDEEG